MLYGFVNKKRLAAALLIVFVSTLFGCERFRERLQENAAQPASNSASPQSVPTANVHLSLGNPSNAAADIRNRDNYLLVGDSYVLSYNDSRGTMNWISWRTTLRDLGQRLPRAEFRPDPRLPAGFRRITTFDYSGSGYNRGHMVPSADRFGDKAANEETFYMTNIVPQAGDLNQEPWEQLESYARSLVRRGFDLYTVAGVYGNKGRWKNKLTIPTNCWKVIVFVPRGSDVLGSGRRAQVIAVDMPNIDGIRRDRWQKYATTVRRIESETGYDLLSALPREVQNKLEGSIYQAAAY